MATLVRGTLVETRHDYDTHLRDFCRLYRRALNDIEQGEVSPERARRVVEREYDRLAQHPGAMSEEGMGEFRKALMTTLDEAVSDSGKCYPRPRRWPTVLVTLGAFAAGALGHELEKHGVNVTALYGTALAAGLTGYGMNKYDERKKDDEWKQRALPPPRPHLYRAPEADKQEDGVARNCWNWCSARAAAGMFTLATLLGTFMSGSPDREVLWPHKALDSIDHSNAGLIIPGDTGSR